MAISLSNGKIHSPSTLKSSKYTENLENAAFQLSEKEREGYFDDNWKSQAKVIIRQLLNCISRGLYSHPGKLFLTGLSEACIQGGPCIPYVNNEVWTKSKT